MRKIFLLLFVLVLTGIVANARTINALPESGFVDGEVSTNVYINLSNTSNKTQFKIDVEFSSNVSNEVQVLLGQDIDTNGVLDTDEADLCFAWTTGFWQLYQIDRPNEILFSYETSGALKKGSYILYLNDDGEPTRFEVIADKTIVLSQELTSDTSLFNSNWNIAKVVHRGSGVENTYFGVKLQAETLLILLK